MTLHPNFESRGGRVQCAVGQGSKSRLRQISPQCWETSERSRSRRCSRQHASRAVAIMRVCRLSPSHTRDCQSGDETPICHGQASGSVRLGLSVCGLRSKRSQRRGTRTQCSAGCCRIPWRDRPTREAWPGLGMLIPVDMLREHVVGA